MIIAVDQIAIIKGQKKTYRYVLCKKILLIKGFVALNIRYVRIVKLGVLFVNCSSISFSFDFFISSFSRITMRIDKGNLVLRHSVSHFTLYILLPERASKKYSLSLVGIHNSYNSNLYISNSLIIYFIFFFTVLRCISHRAG